MTFQVHQNLSLCQNHDPTYLDPIFLAFANLIRKKQAIGCDVTQISDDLMPKCKTLPELQSAYLRQLVLITVDASLSDFTLLELGLGFDQGS